PAASNKDKIVGTWEFVKTTEKNAPPPGATMTFEFTKDGALKMAAKMDGKDLMKAEGTYTVEGDSLSTTMKGPDGKDKTEKAKITTMDNKQLITENEKKETTEFKKK